MAQNPFTGGNAMERDVLTADRLMPGRAGEIMELFNTGPLRRRLTELKSPFSDPTAYRVNGITIALRKSDCSDVLVSLCEKSGGADERV